MRVTPARAGGRGHHDELHAEAAGHPRACGADAQVGGLAGRAARVTPARAGRTRGRRARRSVGTGHPRACGADADELELVVADTRVTPARAGRTHTPITSGMTVAGSPARAGRTGFTFDGVHSDTVSPPRVRGGRSSVSRPRRSSSGHPRACGADPPLSRCASRVSPGHPRACGADVVGRDQRQPVERVTPARAGRTLSTATSPSVGTGSPPRVRGGPSTPSATPGSTSGHPRACGADLPPRRVAPDQVRVTPARAGRTALSALISSE